MTKVFYPKLLHVCFSTRYRRPDRRTIADNDAEYPAIGKEKGQRRQPQPGKEGAHTQELKLVTLLKPGSLRDDPQDESSDTEFWVLVER